MSTLELNENQVTAAARSWAYSIHFFANGCGAGFAWTNTRDEAEASVDRAEARADVDKVIVKGPEGFARTYKRDASGALVLA